MTTAVREKPILFSGDMVRAILEGRKTQTRRVIKPEHVEGIEQDGGKFAFMHCPTCGGYCDYACASAGEVLDGHVGWTPWGSNPEEWGRLWVKEPFYRNLEAANCYYRADNLGMGNAAWAHFREKPESALRSIFLPRAFSRLTLEITGVRVERLQDITETDVLAEGWVKLLPEEVLGPIRNDFTSAVFGRPEWTSSSFRHGMNVSRWNVSPQQAFRSGWEEINGDRPGCSWADNPWVWAITFRRLETGAAT